MLVPFLLVYVIPVCCASALVIVFHLWALATRQVPLRSRAGLEAVLWLCLGLALLNFVLGRALFWGFYMGGDAFAGKVEGGRYFLGVFGRYTEVSSTVWWTSYWHTLLSGLGLAIPVTGILLVRYAGHRSRRRSWIARVRELGERDDLKALYELIDLLDDLTPYESGRGEADRRELQEAIREKTKVVDVAVPLPLSASAPVEVLREQKERWRQWVEAHEADLSKHVSED